LAKTVLFIEASKAKMAKTALESELIVSDITTPEILSKLNIKDRDYAIEQIIKNRQVVLNANFHTIEVRMTWNDPQNAALLANQLVSAIDDIIYPLDSSAFWNNKTVRYEKEMNQIEAILRQAGDKIKNKEILDHISNFFETEEKILENKSYMYIVQEAVPPTKPIDINEISIIFIVAILATIGGIIVAIMQK